MERFRPGRKTIFVCPFNAVDPMAAKCIKIIGKKH